MEKKHLNKDGSSLVWQTTDGQDIYYQGKTTNSLPVSMKVTYKLDGKKTKKRCLQWRWQVEIQTDFYKNNVKNKLLMVKNFMFLLLLQQEQCYQQKQILILKLQMCVLTRSLFSFLISLYNYVPGLSKEL